MPTITACRPHASFTPLLLLVLASTLSACSTLDMEWRGLTQRPAIHWRVPPELKVRLDQSPVCCTSLADLPYQTIDRQGRFDLSIDNDSPVFAFDTGKSRFAAYRLPAWPRPLSLDLASYRTTAPGSLARLMPDLGGLIFHPRVLILDKQHQISQVIDDFASVTDCRSNPKQPALRAQGEIDTPSDQSAYLVILTSEALLAQDGATICGGTLHGFSPIGKLALTLASLGFGDGKIAFKGPFIRFKNANGSKDVGTFSGMFRTPGNLLVTGDGVHFVERKDQAYIERFSTPFERIVSVKAESSVAGREPDLLVLGIGGEKRVDYVTFAADRTTSAAAAERLIRPHISPEWFEERIGLAVADTPPTVKILANVRKSGAGKRIGESAELGGLILALPCGVCAGGFCPPEALVPCSALYAVGAAVGGIIGLGDELLSSGLKTAPQPTSIPETAEVTTVPALQASFTSLLGGDALRQQILEQLPPASDATPSSPAWRSQGRRSNLSPVVLDPANPDASYARLTTEGYHYLVESRIETLSLVPQGEIGQAVETLPVRLRFDAGVRFIDLTRHQVKEFPLTWETEAQPWSAWSALDRRVLDASLGQAREALARRIIETARQAWVAQ
jgi:hypothetical protein